MRPTVIKISGHELNDSAFLREFAAELADQSMPFILVHGGGRDISDLQERLGLLPRFVEGIRVTDAASLAVAEMVLCGVVNKRLVSVLLAAGLDALGISGVDRGLIRARKLAADTDMMFTGEVTRVRSDVLMTMLAQGITPIIAPICLGDDTHYNVNADAVAVAVAQAVHAHQLVYLSNVEGVLDAGRRRLSHLTMQQAHALMADGTINGGMIPKVTTALHAAQQGIITLITDLQGYKTHGGTRITHEDT